MNQNQWNDFLSDLNAVYQKHGFNSRAIKVKGQRHQEEKIQEQKENPYEYYNAETYGSTVIFEEFKKTKNLKLVWARMSASVKEYQLDPVEVANIALDECPATGALIDYGYGLNRVTDNPCFRPGIDHIKSVANGGNKYKDITNIQIVSQYYNTIKNYGSIIDAVKWVNFELKTLNQ